MLDDQRITKIALQVARSLIKGSGLEHVLTEQVTDSEGNDALRITVVLQPAAVQELTGDQALDFLVGIQNQLRDEGETRLPIVDYATKQELESEVFG